MIRRPPRSTRTDTLFPYRRSSDLLSDPASWVHDQAYDCLMVVYLDRRQTLGDRAAAPIATRVIGEIDLGPIVRARPELVEDGNVRIAGMRSEASRVGKECVSTCRSRWSPYHYKKKNKTNSRMYITTNISPNMIHLAP